MSTEPQSDASGGGTDPKLEQGARIAARVATAPLAWVAVVEGESVQRWGSAGCRIELAVRGDRLIVACRPHLAESRSPSPACLRLEVSLREPSASPLHLAVPLGGAACRAGVLCVGDWQPREWAPETEALLEDVAALLAAELALSDLREERRALQSRLQESEQRAGRLASTLRHEFGQPLTVIQGFSELIADEVLAPEEIREYAGEINREACRLAELLARIRELEPSGDRVRD
jgi:signal transduction histidine kinase